jgi:hypothetical protein
MAVCIDRHRDRVIAKLILDVIQILALLDQQARMSVANLFDATPGICIYLSNTGGGSSWCRFYGIGHDKGDSHIR